MKPFHNDNGQFYGGQICYSGGGGASGAVSFAPYLEDAHQEWLGDGVTPSVTTHVDDLYTTALANNPLELLSYEDPSAKETNLEAEQDAFEVLAKAANTETDYGAIVTAAVADVDELGVLVEADISNIIGVARTGSRESLESAVLTALDAIEDQRVFDAVQAFVNARQRSREQLRTRFKAGMVNISAERSSAYALGLAYLEAEFERETSQYQTELSLEMYRQGLTLFAQSLAAEIRAGVQVALANKGAREQLLLASIQQMLQYKQYVFELRKGLVQLLAEVNRINFVMDSEYVGNTADLNTRYSTWDFTALGNVGTFLGSLGGGTYVPEGPTKGASVLGGAVAGAGAGAAFGPVGAGIGAVAGGLAGLF